MTNEVCHVSLGGGAGSSTDGVQAFEEGGVELVARARDIAARDVVNTLTDNEAEGVAFVARARDINDGADDGGVEVAVCPRDINGASEVGPKGLALPKWDAKEHAAAALGAEQKVPASGHPPRGASAAAWSIPLDSIRHLIPAPSAEHRQALVLGQKGAQSAAELGELAYEACLSEELAQGDARRLSYPDEHFSLIYDKASLDSVHGDLPAARHLRELYRVLRPGGVLVCVSRRRREGLLKGALPGLGVPCWSVCVESKEAVVGGAEVRAAQGELARQLGALHQCVPEGEGGERQRLKDLCRAAMAPGADGHARRCLEDEAAVLCRLYAPQLQVPFARALEALCAARDPVPGGVFVHACVRDGVEVRVGGGGDEGLEEALQYMEGVLGLMREEEGGGIMGASDIIQALGGGGL